MYRSAVVPQEEGGRRRADCRAKCPARAMPWYSHVPQSSSSPLPNPFLPAIPRDRHTSAPSPPKPPTHQLPKTRDSRPQGSLPPCSSCRLSPHEDMPYARGGAAPLLRRRGTREVATTAGFVQHQASGSDRGGISLSLDADTVDAGAPTVFLSVLSLVTAIDRDGFANHHFSSQLSYS